MFLIFFFLARLHSLQDLSTPQPGIEPRPLAVKAWSPNHWTTREFPVDFVYASSTQANWNLIKRQTNKTKPLWLHSKKLLNHLSHTEFHLLFTTWQVIMSYQSRGLAQSLLKSRYSFAGLLMWRCQPMPAKVLLCQKVRILPPYPKLNSWGKHSLRMKDGGFSGNLPFVNCS